MSDNFAFILLNWYAKNKRSLPWREEKNPYKIWISEIILQQTRVSQGLNYYIRFIERFPSISSIYEAGEQEVLKYWQGLGYYTRARNIYAAAVYLMENYQGKFPTTYNEILKIKGIGEYTAAAIASFAYQLPYAVIDGNVLRVLSRIFGIYEPIDSTKGKKEIRQLANKLMCKKNPSAFNQAIMDFGATQCVPANPDCKNCCFSNVCYANLHYEQTELPVKTKKIKTRNRYFYYFHISYQNKIYIQKRKSKDIWKGLYEFPLLELDETIDCEKLIAHPAVQNLFANLNWEILSVSSTYKHILSHQTIIAVFINISVDKAINNADFIPISFDRIADYPISRLMEKYLEKITVIS